MQNQLNKQTLNLWLITLETFPKWKMMLCERVNYDVFCVQSINQLHCLQGTLFTGEQEAFYFKIRWYAILRLERNTVKAFLSCQASPDFVGVFYIQSHPCLGL